MPKDSYHVPEKFREDVTYLLRVSSDRAQLLLDEELKNSGLNSRSAAILLIASCGNFNQKLLAENTATHPNAVTLILNSLESKQLVRRLQNPVNRREYFVQVTVAGKKLVADIESALQRATKHAGEKLTPAERKELQRLLLKFLEAWI